ncbi:MAG: hypothetical protein HZB15_09285 [Actinobacteria bacterium]|nr:hypothetical protein [Actinomycetota bacterium]
MRRVVGVLAVGLLGLVGCGDDDDDADSTNESSQTSPSTDSADTAAAADSTASTSAMTSMPPESTTVAEDRAAAALLTPAELTGWTVQPEDDDDDDDDLSFDAPECATLKALDDGESLENDAETTLLSPDQATQVMEHVTAGEAGAAQQAFDAFAAPETATCLSSLFTASLSEPGAMPEGVTLSAVEFAQEPLTAGDQAIGYVATITVTGEETGITAPIGIRFDSVRTGEAIALVLTITTPGGAPVDAAALIAAAGEKLAAAA